MGSAKGGQLAEELLEVVDRERRQALALAGELTEVLRGFVASVPGCLHVGCDRPATREYPGSLYRLCDQHATLGTTERDCPYAGSLRAAVSLLERGSRPGR